MVGGRVQAGGRGVEGGCAGWGGGSGQVGGSGGSVFFSDESEDTSDDVPSREF